jgi:hypothetical protein
MANAAKPTVPSRNFLIAFLSGFVASHVKRYADALYAREARTPCAKMATHKNNQKMQRKLLEDRDTTYFFSGS